jgi:hypothetical protein
MLEKLEKLDEQTRHILAVRIAGQGSLKTISVLALGACVFSLMCLWGAKQGIRQRVPDYPPLSQLLEECKPDPSEATELHLLRWHLQYRGVPANECKDVFQNVILPILREESIRIDEGDGVRTFTVKRHKDESGQSTKEYANLRYTDIMCAARCVMESKALPDPEPRGPRAARAYAMDSLEPVPAGKNKKN